MGWVVGRIQALVLATVILAMLAGTAIGYYVLPDSKGQSAECIILERDLGDLTYRGAGRDDRRAERIIDWYNEECR